MSHDPLDLRGQEQAKQERDERDRLAAQIEAEDTKWLMSTKRGRRIVWRLLERAGVFRLSFNTNAMQMAFAEGARNEGLRTLAHIHAACPESYQVMLAEAKQ